MGYLVCTCPICTSFEGKLHFSVAHISFGVALDVKSDQMNNHCRDSSIWDKNAHFEATSVIPTYIPD